MPHTPLRFSDVSFSYPGQDARVLDHVTCALPRGWSGIVGDNGCGKSTFGLLACRLLAPDSGVVDGPSREPVCAFCAQETEPSPGGLDDFACDFSGLARRLRRDLRISDEMCWRYGELSAGERKRLQVAVALWREPDVLVLDEPTNHVDAGCRAAIARACADFRGVGLLVSHDRALLDALVERCACFEEGGLAVRSGGYGRARAQADAERAEAARARERARRELARLSAEHGRRAAEASRAASRRSARRLDVRDHDGRAQRRRAVVSGQDGAAGRLAARMGSRVEGARDRLSQTRVARRYDGDLWLDVRPCPRPTLLSVGAGRIACGAATLAVPALAIGNADHVGVEGPNGAGKSTLVRHLLARLPDDVPAFILPQELTRAERDRVLARTRALTDEELGRALSVVAQLNTDSDRLLRTLRAGAAPSPGELRKLVLALAALSGAGLLVMDEPTNHLDVHSVEALERALSAYPGALVLVSHDERLLARTCGRRLRVEGGAVREL